MSVPSPKCVSAPQSASSEVVYVSGEVGVGGGVLVGGRRVAGRSGFAGEIGHMPVNPAGRAVPLRVIRVLGDRDRRARTAGRAADATATEGSMPSPR